jgi:hypothetical protein
VREAVLAADAAGVQLLTLPLVFSASDLFALTQSPNGPACERTHMLLLKINSLLHAVKSALQEVAVRGCGVLKEIVFIVRPPSAVPDFDWGESVGLFSFCFLYIYFLRFLFCFCTICIL